MIIKTNIYGMQEGTLGTRPVLNTLWALSPSILTNATCFLAEDAQAHREESACPKWEKSGLGCLHTPATCPRAAVGERLLE